MPYDEELDARIGEAMSGWETTRKKMFGGTCHLLAGNMMCGVSRDALILRLGESAAADALERKFVRQMDVTGRPMKGWVVVDAGGHDGDALGAWLEKAREFVQTLPAK